MQNIWRVKTCYKTKQWLDKENIKEIYKRALEEMLNNY